MYANLKVESKKILARNNLEYKRYFIRENKIKHRLTIITGARGVGKTTTIIQYIHSHSKLEALYVSMDSFLVGELSMYEIAQEFVQNGGKLLCFDEIHKYSNWSQELKSIYDSYPKLRILASGSSALEIHKGSHDLSRRAHVLSMHGMSFKEYLELSQNIQLKTYSLEDILTNHENLAFDIIEKLEKENKKILPLFHQYLKTGYYPYALTIDDEDIFFDMLKQNINVSLSSDLLFVYPSLDGNSVKKLKLLLSIIMESVPFVPIVEKLKHTLGVGDARTVKEYFIKLEEAGILNLLMKSSSKGLAKLEKPEKIYLNNSNLLYIATANTGTVRETFFLNAVGIIYDIKYPAKGDFLVDGSQLFEIGGKNKSFAQIKDIENSYIAYDDVEVGFEHKIPLWLFGFLY
jgi:predicted AAA+ superfamily ATPase